MEIAEGACMMFTCHIPGLDIFVNVVTDNAVGEQARIRSLVLQSKKGINIYLWT